MGHDNNMLIAMSIQLKPGPWVNGTSSKLEVLDLTASTISKVIFESRVRITKGSQYHMYTNLSELHHQPSPIVQKEEKPVTLISEFQCPNSRDIGGT